MNPIFRIMIGLLVAAFGANFAHTALHPVNEPALKIGAAIFAAGVFLVTPEDVMKLLKAVRAFVPWARADGGADGDNARGDAK